MGRLQVAAALVKLFFLLVGLFNKRPTEPDPHTADLSPADRAEAVTKHLPPKPKNGHKVKPRPWDSW